MPLVFSVRIGAAGQTPGEEVITKSHVCPLVSSLRCSHVSVYFALLTACPLGPRPGAGPGLQQGASLPRSGRWDGSLGTESGEVSLRRLPALTAALRSHRAGAPLTPGKSYRLCESLPSLCGCFLACKMVRMGPAPRIEGVTVKQVLGTQWGPGEGLAGISASVIHRDSVRQGWGAGRGWRGRPGAVPAVLRGRAEHQASGSPSLSFPHFRGRVIRKQPHGYSRNG